MVTRKIRINGISKVVAAPPIKIMSEQRFGEFLSFHGKFMERRSDFLIPPKAENQTHKNLIRIDDSIVEAWVR